MKKLHQDPTFKKANAERARKRMKKLNQDPTFKKAHAERARKRMKKLWATPEWRKQQVKLISAGLKKYWGIIHSNLRLELAKRNLITSFDPRTEKPELATTITPEKNILKREQQQTVSKSIQSLPSTEREIIVTRFFEDKDTKQISQETGLTQKQIEETLNSALKKLAKKLKGLL